MATVVILEHELQRRVDIPYMVNLFAGRWSERGHRVLVHHGTQTPPPGDVAILHVDLTVIPEGYRGLFGSYSHVVNGKVLDISKSSFSQNLLRPQDGWDGPVIVKTEANYGGKPEQLWRGLAAQSGTRWEIPDGPVAGAYPIYASLRDVPDAHWHTPGLIVERFLPERDERGHYCVRVWTFFGDCERSVIWRAAEPIVKAGNVLERDLVPVPDEMRAWRAKLGFDFGKFDYVRHGADWVLLDANRTPSAPVRRDGPIADAIAELGDGLESYLR